MADLHERINTRGAVDAWARYTIERFQKKLGEKKIGKTGNLKRSFKYQLQSSGQDVKSVSISFALYGRFRDMGVGRGLKAYERASNKANQRAVKDYGSDLSYTHRGDKRWFNKPKMAQIYRLRELLASDIGNAVLATVQDGLRTGDVRVNM